MTVSAMQKFQQENQETRNSESRVQVELCLPARSTEVLHVGTCECDLIWRQSLRRCERVKKKVISPGPNPI